MTDKDTIETNERTGSRVSPSRRSFLGSVAVAGVLASVPTGVFGRQDDAGEGESDLEVITDFEPPSMPENLAINAEGTVDLSMGPSGEIRAVDSDGNESSVAMLETGEGVSCSE